MKLSRLRYDIEQLIKHKGDLDIYIETKDLGTTSRENEYIEVI